MEKYIKIFNSLTQEQKNDFLVRALATSNDLQAQFINFFTKNISNEIYDITNFEEIVINKTANYIDILEAIDFNEPDYDRIKYHGDRYYEEWELLEEAIVEEVADVFALFETEIKTSLSKGDLSTSMACVTALLIACYEANIENEESYMTDLEGHFEGLLHELCAKIEVVLCQTIFNIDVVNKTLKAIIQCFNRGEANRFRSDFHDRLCRQLLINCNECCSVVYDEISSNKDITVLFPVTYLYAVRNIQPLIWEAEAESICMLNVEIAKELLEYQSEFNIDGFFRNAKMLFPVFKEKIVDVVVQKMPDDYDVNFSRDILYFKVEFNKKLDDYKRLKPLISESEKLLFINKFRSSFDYSFYIKMLEEEKMYDEILEFAKSFGGYLSAYCTILKPIIDRYPNECFSIIKSKTLNLMENNTGRTYYEQVAELLRFAVNTQALVIPVLALANELIKLYPRRSALREELKCVR